MEKSCCEWRRSIGGVGKILTLCTPVQERCAIFEEVLGDVGEILDGVGHFV